MERKRHREDDYEIAMKRYLARKPRKIDWPDGRRPSRKNCMTALVFVDMARRDANPPQTTYQLRVVPGGWPSE